MATEIRENNPSLAQSLLYGCLRVLSALRRLPLVACSWCSQHPIFTTFVFCITFIAVISTSLAFVLGERSQTHEVINGAASQSGVSYFFGLIQVCHITDSPWTIISSCSLATFTKWIWSTRLSVSRGSLSDAALDLWSQGMASMAQHTVDSWPYQLMYLLTGLSSASLLSCYYQLNYRDFGSSVVANISYNPNNKPQDARSFL